MAKKKLTKAQSFFQGNLWKTIKGGLYIAGSNALYFGLVALNEYLKVVDLSSLTPYQTQIVGGLNFTALALIKYLDTIKKK